MMKIKLKLTMFLLLVSVFTGTAQDYTVDLNIQSIFSDIPDEQGGKGTYAFLRGKWSY